MLLGKRARSHMKRTTSMRDVVVMKPTTSMRDIMVDLGEAEAALLPAVQEVLPDIRGYQLKQRNVAAVASIGSMRVPRRSSAAVETAPFLRACALCKGRLHPGLDIFMYRGEIAFCSSECRQQQINHDERREKEKCFIYSMKKVLATAQATSTASKASNTGGEVAAA